ncbi:MAG: TetR/AcrR family transcriptional regulator [Actinomycetota bacterium]
MAEKRPYRLKKRAEQYEETRRRITEATMELHRTVGPAATRISEIARRAGVERVTVYNHFPVESALFSACSEHWRSLHPAPDPSKWFEIEDPGVRLRTGLMELYGWYRETESMTANVLRDADTVPAIRSILDAGLGGYLNAVVEILTKGFDVAEAQAERLRVAGTAAINFHLWQALSSLGDDDAAELATCLVERAASDTQL